MKNKAIILIILAGCFFWTQRPVLAQWTPPPGNPPQGSAHLFINPMIENLDLNSFNLFDDNTGSGNFLLDPGGPVGLRLESSGLDWAGYFGKTYVSELCIGYNDDPNNCVTELGGDSFWQQSPNGADIYFNAGNVGIGTNSPNKKLHIFDSSVNAEIDIQSVAGANNHWGIYQDRTSADLIFWQTNNRVVFTNEGQVGINITQPRYLLDIGRSNNNNTAIINIQDKDNDVDTGLRLEIGSGSSAAEKWFIGMANPTHELLFRSTSIGNPANNLIRLNTRGVLTLAGQESNLYMNGNGSLDGTTGNIYIQDNSTVDGVDISDYSDYFIDTAGSNGRVWTSDGAGRGYWGAVGGGGGDGYIGLPGTHTAGGQLNMGNFNINLDGEWLSGDGGDEGISIDNNGTVILSGNLVSPTGAMVVATISAGTVNITNTLNAGNITAAGNITTSANLFLNSLNGRLGIGTVTPNHQLHLYKASGDNSELDIQSVAGAGNHWGIYQDRASADLFFWQDDNRVVFTDEGRVGIGTAVPAYTLDVFGSIHGTSYFSSDGSAGITRTINVGTCTITVKNGLITATTCP